MEGDVKFHAFIKVLRQDGWVKDFEQRSTKWNPGVAAFRKVVGDKTLELQLWRDGGHRVSFFRHGSMSTAPTSFETVEEMKAAIDYEIARKDGTHR